MLRGSGSSWARRTTSRRCSRPGKALQEADIRYEVRVMSAHRDPEKVREYCHAARMRGLRVLIAGAGMSAALPGVAAAHTDLPVIGVPILGKSLGGLDALLSAVQMPPGVPVACVAVDGAKNAGLLAAADNQFVGTEGSGLPSIRKALLRLCFYGPRPLHGLKRVPSRSQE